jgi:hypothetical protein
MTSSPSDIDKDGRERQASHEDYSEQLASWYTAGQIFEVQVPLQEGARIDCIKVMHRLIL